MKTLRLLYGFGGYTVGLGSLVYMIGWLGGFLTSTSIDSGAGDGSTMAVTVNLGLFMAFCLPHSVMARPWFKKALTKVIDSSVERSTYVLLSGISLAALMLFWQPMPSMVWNVTNAAGSAVLFSVYAMGWMILVGSTFALNHFDLFGLRQVVLHMQKLPYTDLPFATPGPYRLVRHPIYVGWVTLVWATPTMTIGHLLFAAGTTAYILIAIQFEERDLVDSLGQQYTEYQQSTPMLVPGLPKKAAAEK